MIRISKYFQGLCLTVAGLALIFHMIIPHDHHMTDYGSFPYDNCPASESKNTNNDGSPVHCYSLNDLASEKATRFIITDHIKFSVIQPVSQAVHSVLYPVFCSLVTVKDQVMPSDSWLVESLPLRAPPSVS